MRILVVDDAVFIRKVLKGILHEVGEEVVGEASNGTEALRLVAELKPDVVTLDITLPDYNGIELLRKIHEIVPDISIVMVTAISNHEMIKEAMQYGAVGYITKPFSREKVEEVLQKIKSVRDKKAKLPLESREEVEETKENVSTMRDIVQLKDTIEDTASKEKESLSVFEAKSTPGQLAEEEKIFPETAEKNISEIGSGIETKDKNVLREVRLEKKKGEEILTISFSKDEYSYSIGKLKIGSGIIVSCEDCYLSSSLQHEYFYENSVIEGVKLEEINGSTIVIIYTKAKKYNVRESEGELSIILLKAKGSVSYSKNNKVLMLDNIPPNTISVTQLEDRKIKISVKAADIYLEEEKREVDDIIIKDFSIEKSEDGYDIIVTLHKEAVYELIEGKSVTGVKFTEIKVLRDIQVVHSEEETKIELVTNCEEYNVVLEQDQDKGITYAYLYGFAASPGLLNKEFEFKEEYIERIRVIEDKEKGLVCLVIYSPVKRLIVAKDRNKTVILARPNKAFLLYNMFQNILIFQNILPHEIEIDYDAVANEVFFLVKNRFVKLHEDPLLKSEDFETFSSIEVQRVENGYEGKIKLKTRCKVDISVSKDGTSTNLSLIPLKKLNKIKAFEYESKGAKSFLRFMCEGDIKYVVERNNTDRCLEVRVFTSSVETIENRRVEFQDGCVERIEFKEDIEDVLIYIYTDVIDYLVEFRDNMLSFVFEPQVIFVHSFVEEERVAIELSGIDENNIEIIKEEEVVVYEIKRRDIYIEKGIQPIDSKVVKKIQIVQDKNYKIMMHLVEEKVRSKVEKIDNGVYLIIEKYPTLEAVTINNINEHKSTIVLKFDLKIYEKLDYYLDEGLFILNLGEINANQENTLQQDEISKQIKSSQIIREVNLREEQGIYTLEVKFNYAKVNLIHKEKELIIEFEIVIAQIEASDQEIVISNVEINKTEVKTFPENGVVVIKVPENSGYFNESSLMIQSDRIKDVLLAKLWNESIWIVMIIMQPGEGIHVNREEDVIVISY